MPSFKQFSKINCFQDKKFFQYFVHPQTDFARATCNKTTKKNMKYLYFAMLDVRDEYFISLFCFKIIINVTISGREGYDKNSSHAT